MRSLLQEVTVTTTQARFPLWRYDLCNDTLSCINAPVIRQAKPIQLGLVSFLAIGMKSLAGSERSGSSPPLLLQVGRSDQGQGFRGNTLPVLDAGSSRASAPLAAPSWHQRPLGRQ